MTTNPMARKARNSFLLGVVLMLIIALIVGATFWFLVLKKNDGGISSNEKIVFAFRLKQDVKYGEEITKDMVEAVTISEKVAPAGTFNSKVQDAKTEKWIDSAWTSGYKAKIDLKAGTILGSTLTYTEELGQDIRLTEYNMLTLPTTLDVGNIVDIRLRLGNGTDFIVVSKKYVENVLGDTISLNLSEEEILLMDSAVVEAYLSNTAELYVIQYVDGGMQEAATGNYVPSSDVKNLITNNPNVITEAKTKYTQTSRELIDSGLSDKDSANLETGIKTQVENAKKAREAYLNGLTTY